MTRPLSSTDAAQVASPIVGIVEFLAIALPTGTLYLTSGDRAYLFSGHTYSPANGQWGITGNYNEAADAIPRPMTIQLSGVDSTLVQNLAGHITQWAQITYSLGFTDAAGNLLDNPSFTAPMFLGDCSIVLNEGTGTVSISAENLMADLQNRNSGQLQTNGDQQSRFSGDTFYAGVSALINKVIFWGQLGPSQVGKGVGAPAGPTGLGGGGDITIGAPGTGGPTIIGVTF